MLKLTLLIFVLYLELTATQVLILGHSFISRFQDFLRFNVRADVNLNLNLNPHSEQVCLRGYPGANIDKDSLHSADINPQITINTYINPYSYCQFT
jgi:hypothetical protein